MVIGLAAAAADTTVAIDYVLPAWAVIAMAIATLAGTVLGTLQLVVRAVQPIHEEIRAWMVTTDVVTAQAPRWDEGLTKLADSQRELAQAVQQLVYVTETLGNVQIDIATIRAQVDRIKDAQNGGHGP